MAKKTTMEVWDSTRKLVKSECSQTGFNYDSFLNWFIHSPQYKDLKKNRARLLHKSESCPTCGFKLKKEEENAEND